MAPLHQFARVDFSHFKAFKRFSLELRHFNILVGPNNAGKSTVLAAFRILESAMRKARRTAPQAVRGPRGPLLGHDVDISQISVAEENIFHNYDDSEPATVTFHLSNSNTLTLYFPEQGTCILLADAQGKSVSTPTVFKSHFNCPIGFVPILGPVEHHEQLYTQETARRSLFSYGAARHFRNIWFHHRDHFDTFQETLRLTWPGMDIRFPEVVRSRDKPHLYMYCLENRISWELFWSGFGFQVWVQMLTHLIQANDKSIFLIDEPDIYLHSDIQRQLLGLLRNLGPDILIATHSTEIISEAETDDIVLVTKMRTRARRIRQPSQLSEVFRSIGSNINPVLTQVAKTRRALFVEGKDFQIFGKFARRFGLASVGSRSDFAVVPIEGFNPERVRYVKSGMEETLGRRIVAAVILDKDYRSSSECISITERCREFCDFVEILERKEVENFLLVPSAIDRAAGNRVADREKRSEISLTYRPQAHQFLMDFAVSKRSYVNSQLSTSKRHFERGNSPQLHETTVIEAALAEFEVAWANEDTRLHLIPGKEALASINNRLQELYGITVTPTSIIDAMTRDEVPNEMTKILKTLEKFATSKPRSEGA